MKLEEITNVKMLQGMVRELWDLLDDVDTMDDACRSSDSVFRLNVREIQKKRAGILTSDGFNLHLPGTEPKTCGGCGECPKAM